MQMSGQMLQEEGHALVNDRLFYHLIIVQNEDDGSRMRRLSFQLMEKHGKTGGKRRWLGRLQLCYHVFPKVRWKIRAAAQGRNQRDPEACRAVVQFVQREPGHLRLLPVCPNREQRGFAPARRGREQGQRCRKRLIEGSQQAFALHQGVRQSRRSKSAGEQHHSLLGRGRGLLRVQERARRLL